MEKKKKSTQTPVLGFPNSHGETLVLMDFALLVNINQIFTGLGNL